MKLLIASDIHGSAHYCGMLLEKFKAEKADKLLLLGDILYHGLRNETPEGYDPREIIKMLNQMKDKIICVRGNCDAEIYEMVLDFPALADYAAVPVGNRIMYASHGHIYNEEHLPSLCDGDILLNGHTHIPKVTVHEHYIYINSGSVSVPKDNTPHSYIVFENDRFIWKNLKTDEAFMKFDLNLLQKS